MRWIFAHGFPTSRPAEGSLPIQTRHDLTHPPRWVLSSKSVDQPYRSTRAAMLFREASSHTMTERWAKKYDWHLTPGSRLQDEWSAYHGHRFIGRIWREISPSSNAGKFGWQAAQKPPRRLPDSGWESSHRKAAKAVEDFYDAGRGFDTQPSSAIDTGA